MRLFVFAVGGTGSRVLKSLIMLLAAGVRPKDKDGNSLKEVEIVPIVVDPHKANDDLKRTEDLLKWYRDIRQSVYGNDHAERGFFSVKISTLKEIMKNTSTSLADTFLFNLGDVETKKFRDFIHFNSLTDENHALCSSLFSEDNLETKMNIGFVGSPNIGSVALNQFKDSAEFKGFADIFKEENRVFIISSIFGGTGAAGFPIIVKNIRDAKDSSAVVGNKGTIRNAKIGALTVLPYFDIETDTDSPISITDFIVKTQSALYYYDKSLTGDNSLNACYYLGDELKSDPYKNDPGNNGQKNKAHIIETIGALSIVDFMSISDDKLATEEGKATTPLFREYGLANGAETINLMDLGKSTRRLINKEMVKFHLFRLFIKNEFENRIGQGFTQDAPEIKKGFLSASFYRTLSENFFVQYDIWLKEMADNRRHFVPFKLEENDIAKCINGIEAKKSFLKGAIDYMDIFGGMTTKSKKKDAYSDSQVPFKLFDLFEQVVDEIIDEKYNSLT
ncbi:hypothetical protein AGMMS4957_09570 [Bacteroidia bacterium]|nr:hypothetical protein AGMMS4957_09570 [Bacteroidia bacterium]